MDKHTYAIERARSKVLQTQAEEARRAGETTRYADLLRQLRSSERKIQEILQNTYTA